MSLSDRLIYQATYSPIKIEEEKPSDDSTTKKPSDDSTTKKDKDKPLLTIYQKNCLLNDIFMFEDKYISAVDLVKKRIKNPSNEIKLIAEEIENVFKLSNKSTRNIEKILKIIAKLDDKKLIELINNIFPKESKDSLKAKKGKESEGIKIYNLSKEFTGSYKSSSGPCMYPYAYKYYLQPAFGFMHLERLRFAPVGTERGELLFTLPLGPGEEVFLTQKTWAKTNKEFTEMVQNVMEQEITTQRTETLELSESTKNQNQYSADMSTSVQGGGSIGVVKVSGSAESSLSASMTSTKEESLKRNFESTEKATSRSKQEHKTTFQISSEVGYEDESRRKIKNPNQTHAVRYDYFRYMRKWQIDLERYGVRLTMDVMVSDPSDKLRKIFEEQKRLEELASGSFECPYTVDDIDESNLPIGISAKPQPYSMVKTDRKDEPTWSSGLTKDFNYEFTIPDGYEADSAEVKIIGRESGTPNVYQVTPNSSVRGSRGTLTIKVHVGLEESEDWVEYSITLYVKPTSENIINWENSVVQAMCLEEKEKWQAERVDAETRLAELVKKESEIPTLNLRKEEREEIMAGVLRQFLPPTITPEMAPPQIVQFIHEAFEFENMSYFLYPYFWNDNEIALNVTHPDSLRKDFLKSGWARVLLPVNPLYEEKILAYAYSGNPNELIPSSSPLKSIAEQTMDAHKTTYAYEKSPEGITKEKYVTIAKWYEYTPTDGIDMTANLITGDIAEPKLAEKLTDEHKQRGVEIDISKQDREIREIIANIIENLPDEVKIKILKSGIGDEIELDTTSGP